MSELTPDAAVRLREQFPKSAIGHLPKGGTQLDYVGHAAVTDRLLQVDPEWTWEPVAYAEDGGPLIRYGQKEAELWIRLTVCGHTRIGVGTAQPGAFELSKQLISDGIRNTAMRFGVALDLWSKEELHAPPDPEPMTSEQHTAISSALAALSEDDTADVRKWWKAQRYPKAENLNAEQAEAVIRHLSAVAVGADG